MVDVAEIPADVPEGGDGVVVNGLRCVFGGGGPFGIAWMLGVADTLALDGVDLSRVPVLGTSAGTWAAAAVHLGVRTDDFFDIAIPARPSVDRGALHRIAESLFGHAHDPLLGAVAVNVLTARRVVIDSRAPVSAQIAASSALPGLVPPYHHRRLRVVDGGVRSTTSVDLAAPGSHLLVLAPMSGRSLTAVGALVQRQVMREVVSWKTQNPHSAVTVISPDDRCAGQAGWPHRFFDAGRMEAVYAAACEQTTEMINGDVLDVLRASELS
jgi:predicted acylesterase/phospholipase RssA